jgi:zinc D-Ala-D-Ala carboxypeptidase
VRRELVAGVVVALCVSGCAVVPVGGSAASDASGVPGSVQPATAASATSASASASPTAAASSVTPSVTSKATPTASAPVDTPFTVNGIVLVNRLHPVTKAYVPASVGNADGLSADLNAALKKLFADAAAHGLSLHVRSGYRSYATQADSYAQARATYDEATANLYFAKPGMSEHQTGLACDLTNAAGDRGDAFKAGPEAAYLAEHATDFGLIIRYPKDGTAITGYGWEPWHVRYVGPTVAAYFAAHPGLTLEEYLGQA